MRVFCARRQSFSPRKKHENVAVGDVFPRAFSSESDEFSLDSVDRDSLNSFPMATDGEALENQT